MRRSAIALLFMVLLSGCYGEIDPCTFDRSVPACDLSRSKAQATISAINSEAALRSTQSAIYLASEATKAAISVKATRQVVQAEATHSAMNTDATRQAIAAAAEQNAVIYRSTQTSVDAEATKIAVGVSGAVERARVEREAVPASSAFNIAVFWFLLPALAVIGVIVLGRRTVEATTQAMHKRAAMITYGPQNNPQLAFVTFDPKSGQPIRFITSEGMIGNTANLLTGATALDGMNIPEPLRLAAMVESSKRAAAARIAAATNSAPWSVIRNSGNLSAETFAPQETISPPDPASTQPGERISVDVRAWDEIFKSWRPTPERMMLAFDANNEPIYAALNDLLSGVIIGRQKQGKTTFMRFIYAQCLMIGVDVRVWDLHEDVVDDLPGASASTTASAIKRSSIEAINELDRRIRLRLKNGRAQPVMILADEVNQLVGVVPEVITTFERIIAEGRKYDIYCDVSAKGVPADLFGQSWVRDSVNTRVAFLTTPHQARLIGIDSESSRLVQNLTPGHAVLDGPVPAQIVTFPNVTADHVRSIIPAFSGKNAPLRATSPASSEAVQPVFRSGSEGTAKAAIEVAHEADDPFEDSPHVDDPQRQMVLEMLREGKSQNRIIKDVYGASGGEKYQRAAAEIRQIIQESIG